MSLKDKNVVVTGGSLGLGLVEAGPVHLGLSWNKPYPVLRVLLARSSR
jgi:hypothetical protein